jgi:hypothetical protein
MSRPALSHRSVLASLSLACIGAAWWSCANATGETVVATTTTSSSTTTTSSGSGTGGTGGVNLDGGGGGDDGGACVSTSVTAHHVPLDLIFVIDQSVNLAGTDWMTITGALETFFDAPASDSIGVGLLFFPYSPGDCYLTDYEALTVPLAPLPGNAFNLTNALPAAAEGIGTPIRPALHGALLQATALQDANPTHRVAVVLASAGDLLPAVPGSSDAHECGDTTPLTVWDKLAELTSGALSYDGVRTFVIGVPGATITDLDEVADAGGTGAAFDATDITKFATAIAQIREAGLGCDYAIPPPPGGQALNPGDVNFSYAPGGSGTPVTLLRATDLAACNGQPGWYYDNNSAPTEIILCPASCSTVENDTSGVVNVLYGCKSLFM